MKKIFFVLAFIGITACSHFHKSGHHCACDKNAKTSADKECQDCKDGKCK